MHTIKISICPLEIVANNGKLIPKIIKEVGLIMNILFLIIKKVKIEQLSKEIKLNRFFDIS